MSIGNKGNKGLWIAIIFAILLASFPLYGRALGDALFGPENTHTMTGTVKEKGSDYIVLSSTKIYLKGDWQYNGTTYTSEELIAHISVGERLTVEYTENPRWGAMAEKITFPDGSTAVKEE
ncbi:MAG: hypothetical protein GXO25_04490 [Euryarchaeota archaeon]|nr:hypothetical protein [Euryarchaeota archaeon]